MVTEKVNEDCYDKPNLFYLSPELIITKYHVTKANNSKKKSKSYFVIKSREAKHAGRIAAVTQWRSFGGVSAALTRKPKIY